MKTIASILLLLIFCLMMSQPDIQYKPFKIRLESLPMGLGTLFIVLGVICFMAQGRYDAVRPRKTQAECLKEEIDRIAAQN